MGISAVSGELSAISMYNFRGQTRFIMRDTQMVNYKKELLSHGFIFYINVIHSFLVSNSLFSKGKKNILLF